MRRVAAWALAGLLVAASPAQAGSLAMHVAAGDWAGRHATSDRDAVLLGVLTHAALDASLREFVVAWPVPGEVRRHAAYLLADVALAAVVVWRAVQEPDQEVRHRRLLGIAGGLLPDVVDGAYALACSQCWMRGDLLLPWHSRERRQMGEGQTLAWAVTVVVATW